MNNTANGVVEDILKEQVSATLDEQKIKVVAKCICERLREKGMLQRENQVKSNEILFAVKEEKEPELVQLCEQYMYFLKERREDGSLVFEGRAGKQNATKKMIIAGIILKRKDIFQNLQKWIWSEGGYEENALEEAIRRGY